MIKESKHVALNKNKWDRRSATYDDKKHDYFRFMQKRVIAIARLKNGQRFLDIGCGTGWAVGYAANLVGGDGEAYGIDIAPKMIERAKVNARELKNVRFFQADAAALPFEDNLFDVIICTNSFHHYVNPGKVLDEVYRVLKKGGRLFILDFTADGLISREINRGFQKREPEHVKFYSTPEYRHFFNAAKLNYIASRSLFPLILFMKIHIAEKESG